MGRRRLFPFLALALLFCKQPNRTPDTPVAPTGPGSGFVDSIYTFTATATDPDADNVAIRFDWGDSVVSPWSDFIRSDSAFRMEKKWDSPGVYAVRVQARDSRDHVTEWSEPLTIAIETWLNRRPNPPSAPTGPAAGYIESTYVFTASANDVDADSVAIRFDWGDGDTSAWSTFVPGDSPVSMTHSWRFGGTRRVRAQTIDLYHALSAWSTPATIELIVTEGHIIWWFAAEDQMSGSPAIGPDGTIYIGSSDYYMYAVNPDGTLKWRYLPGGSVYRSAPAVGTDGTIYFGSGDESLHALHPDGTPKWDFNTQDYVYSSPAIGADGTVYVGSQADSVYAVNLDGSRKWSYGAADDFDRSSPAVAPDGTVYLGSEDDYLYALNSDGSLKWRYCCKNLRYSSPAIGADGTVYIGSMDSSLYAIGPDSTLKWRFKAGDDVSSPPVVAPDGTVYFGTDGNRLWAARPDGSPKWSYLTGGDIRSAAVVLADGAVCFGSEDDYLYCLNPDGTLKWRVQTGGSLYYSSPAVAPDGTIYVGSYDGCLYAIKGPAPLADAPWPKFHHDNRNTGRAGGP